MYNTIGQLISNHLESLGYKIEDESKDGECKFYATIAGINPLLITVKKELVYVFAVYGFWKNEILDSLTFHNFIHKANHSSNFAKWYPHKTGDGSGVVVTITTCFFGYEKESFEKILMSFNDDTRKYFPGLLAFKQFWGGADNG